MSFSGAGDPFSVFSRESECDGHATSALRLRSECDDDLLVLLMPCVTSFVCLLRVILCLIVCMSLCLFWLLLAAPGGLGGSWRLLVAPGGSWRLLAAPAVFCSR